MFQLEIIQSGLQLKLDMQCVREQFLRLLETYSYAEHTLLRRPSPPPPNSPTGAPISSGRARVRALYDARRQRMQARREKFAQEIASSGGYIPTTPRSRRRIRVPPSATVSAPYALTSSEGLSDSTSFDDWELKSVSSGDMLDARDCSNYRHNNSPSSDGAHLTNSSPDSDMPAANSSSSGGGNTTTSSDGTGILTKLMADTVVDKENVRPEHYDDARNNNLSDRGDKGDTQKLEPITEEHQQPWHNNDHSPNNESQLPDVFQPSILPNTSDIHSYHDIADMHSFQDIGDIHSYQDIDMDENGYVVMRDLDPHLMDYSSTSNFAEGGGEAFQSRFSGFSNFSQEIPRTCHNSYHLSITSPLHDTSSIPASPFRDSSIPIYTARSNLKDIEGEYVMLKSPFYDAGDYVTLKAPKRHQRLTNHSMMSFYDQLEPSMLLQPESSNIPWSTTAFDVTGNFGPNNIITCSQVASPPQKSPNVSPRKESPKYAPSELITQLYTKDRSLRDISNISRISSHGRGRGFDDSAMGDTTIGSMLGFGSPDTYPLNSTMKVQVSAGNNTMVQQVEDSDDTLENIGEEDMPEPPFLPRKQFDQRTSFSEPSAICHAPDATRLSLSSPKSMDDSFLDNYEQPDQHLNTQDYSPEDFVTPIKKLPKKPQLCKEHGLHPTFGGPCIFEDSFDVLDTSTEEDETSQNTDRSSRKSRQSRSSQYVTDTDCDSSYLSECVDDTINTTQEFKQESKRYTYDARNARMKMLRRQTGQSDINHLKPAIGLSETDLHHDVTRTRLSLEATRTSLPDLANLSVPPSEYSVEDQDSTLKLVDNSKETSSVPDQSSNVFNKATQGRPLSISTISSTIATTTTDESPESNGGIPVPVNSPNVTDSGSSRPTTDNYDYVDFPPRDMIPKYDRRMPPPRAIPPRRHPGVGSSFVVPVGSGRQYTPIGSNSSGSEPKAKRNISGSLGSIPQKQYTTHRSSQDKQPKHHRSQYSLQDQRYRSSGHRSEGMESVGSGHRHRYPRSAVDSGVETHHHRRHRHQQYEAAGSAEMSSRARRAALAEPPITSAQNLSRERKKVLAKKLKQFSNNFYNSTGNLQIKTLGHF